MEMKTPDRSNPPWDTGLPGERGSLRKTRPSVLSAQIETIRKDLFSGQRDWKGQMGLLSPAVFSRLRRGTRRIALFPCGALELFQASFPVFCGSV